MHAFPSQAIFILHVQMEVGVSSKHRPFWHPVDMESWGFEVVGKTIGIVMGKTQTQHKQVLRGQPQKVRSPL